MLNYDERLSIRTLQEDFAKVDFKFHFDAVVVSGCTQGSFCTTETPLTMLMLYKLLESNKVESLQFQTSSGLWNDLLWEENEDNTIDGTILTAHRTTSNSSHISTPEWKSLREQLSHLLDSSLVTTTTKPYPVTSSRPGTSQTQNALQQYFSNVNSNPGSINKWLQLLPCTDKAGLGSFVHSEWLNKASYHALTLDARLSPRRIRSKPSNTNSHNGTNNSKKEPTQQSTTHCQTLTVDITLSAVLTQTDTLLHAKLLKDLRLFNSTVTSIAPSDAVDSSAKPDSILGHSECKPSLLRDRDNYGDDKTVGASKAAKQPQEKPTRLLRVRNRILNPRSVEFSARRHFTAQQQSPSTDGNGNCVLGESEAEIEDSSLHITVTESLPQYYDILLLHTYKYTLISSPKGNNSSSGGGNVTQGLVVDLPSFVQTGRDCRRQYVHKRGRNVGDKWSQLQHHPHSNNTVAPDGTGTDVTNDNDIHHDCYPTISYSLTLPPHIVLTTEYTVRKRFISRHHQPPDSSRGFIVPPMMVTATKWVLVTSESSDNNIVDTDFVSCQYGMHSGGTDLIEPNRSCYVLSPQHTQIQYTSPVLLSAPIPDLSMPYNVITLVSTLMAFFVGSLINALWKKHPQKKSV